MKQRYIFLGAIFLGKISFAQTSTYNLNGTLVDAKDTSGLISAAVAVSPVADTTQFVDAETDIDGNFQLSGLKSGQYIFKATYIGYTEFRKTITIGNADVNLGTLKMAEESKLLNTVTIEETATRVEQKKDTTEYNANAFKTNPDAVAADLVSKMPGITNNNGTITAQGQAVQKVLIDGKEFFGSDVNTALQNLPADVIDKIQVFDKLSDQAAFTGFDDGNSQKTINIKTKRGITNAVFGKVYGGLGYINNARYSAGGNVNWFKGDRRISLLVMSNNVNQQNFSSDDLAGVMSGSSGGGGGRGGGGNGGGGGGASTLTSAPQSGISTSHAVGLNFNDVWGKKKNFKFQG
ncbi:MAG TPA: carboxypeptidase-like regulatory domain-containing protein, partial [Chitinophagales bacterium]